jgi:hypothetical protein
MCPANLCLPFPVNSSSMSMVFSLLRFPVDVRRAWRVRNNPQPMRQF